MADLTCLLELPQTKNQQLRLGDFRQHVNQLVLNQLVRSNGFAAKLLAFQGPAPCRVVTSLGASHGSPGNAVASLVETQKSLFQALGLRQKIGLWHSAVVKDQLRGDGGPQGVLVVIVVGGKALSPLFHQEAANVIVLAASPHHRDIGNASVGDPGLGTIQDIFVSLFASLCPESGRIGAGVGLGQSKTTNGGSRLKLG